MKRYLCILVLLLTAAAFGPNSHAQFKEEAFSQNYNDDPDSPKDSTDVMFSFKEFFGGIAHKNTLKPGNVVFGSAIMPGTGQIYNKDYWKLPIVYTGLIGGIAGGFYFKNQDNKKASTLCFAAAGLTYWGMALDEIICYDAEYPSAGKATIYSLLVPGLGQIYNGETWTSTAKPRGMIPPATPVRFRRRLPCITATSTVVTGTIPCWPSPDSICCRS